MTAAAVFLAIAVAIVMTAWLHARGGFWCRRVGRTRFRRANLPVGGAVMVLAALVVPAAAEQLVAAGVAMSVVAAGWRLVDPLGPAPVRP